MGFLPAYGFALSSRPFSEADKIAQFYTLQLGRVKALVKGARKPKSRMAPALELLTESSFSLNKKAGGVLYVLGQAKVRDDYHNLKEDFSTITVLQLLADILIHALPDHEPNPEIYTLLKQFLAGLRKDKNLREQLITAFIIHFLDLSGYPLELSACAECGTNPEKNKATLIPHRGGALCGDCSASLPERLKITPADLAFLRQMKKLPLDKVRVLKLRAPDSRRLFRTMLDYLEHTIEKQLKTINYYLQVVQS